MSPTGPSPFSPNGCAISTRDDKIYTWLDSPAPQLATTPSTAGAELAQQHRLIV
jgi:hypothetical protein